MRVRRLLSLLLLTVLVAAGCGDSGAGDGPPVRDIAEILEGAIVVEASPDGRSARVLAETSVDAACAVVFGTDPDDLVGLATDDDMAGGGHRDHGPVLRGLEPDTEYFYRLQGTAEGGDLFASELLSFRTPPAAEAAPDTGNLALDATVVDVSSEFSASFAAANAIDGDPNTEWSSRGDGDDAYIVLDLGGVVDVGGLAFRTRSMSDGTAITETFTVAVDGGAEQGPFPADEVVEFRTTGQVLRMDVATSTGGNTGAVEIEVYGP